MKFKAEEIIFAIKTVYMEFQRSDSLKFNYSDIFFSYLLNNESQCTQMARNHVLMYVYSGEFVVEEGSKKTVIHKGESVFIRRDHRVVMTKQPAGTIPFMGIFLILKRQFLNDFFHRINSAVPKERNTRIPSVIRLNNNVNIDSLFNSMLPYFDVNIVPQPELMELKLQEGVYSLLSIDPIFYQILFDFTEPWKIDILQFMENNYMYELTIDEFASFTGRSLSTFKRDFKKISDLPPQKWLIQRRLRAAYDMIRNEGKKVKDVYMDVGFKNQSHFSLAFKKQYGFYPSEAI